MVIHIPLLDELKLKAVRLQLLSVLRCNVLLSLLDVVGLMLDYHAFSGLEVARVRTFKHVNVRRHVNFMVLTFHSHLLLLIPKSALVLPLYDLQIHLLYKVKLVLYIAISDCLIQDTDQRRVELARSGQITHSKTVRNRNLHALHDVNG